MKTKTLLLVWALLATSSAIYQTIQIYEWKTLTGDFVDLAVQYRDSYLQCLYTSEGKGTSL